MNKKGFTLAELLIVVAIIAILVGIGIPVFTTQLEKSREAADLANVRSAYADMMQEIIGTDTTNQSITVELTQKQNGWTTNLPLNVAGVVFDGNENEQWIGSPEEGGTCEISYFDEKIHFIWSGEGSIDPMQQQLNNYSNLYPSLKQFGKFLYNFTYDYDETKMNEYNALKEELKRTLDLDEITFTTDVRKDGYLLRYVDYDIPWDDTKTPSNNVQKVYPTDIYFDLDGNVTKIVQNTGGSYGMTNSNGKTTGFWTSGTSEIIYEAGK